MLFYIISQNATITSVLLLCFCLRRASVKLKSKPHIFLFCLKCQHCEKTFINSTFLQNHMQRRHPEEYDVRK